MSKKILFCLAIFLLPLLPAAGTERNSYSWKGRVVTTEEHFNVLTGQYTAFRIGLRINPPPSVGQPPTQVLVATCADPANCAAQPDWMDGCQQIVQLQSLAGGLSPDILTLTNCALGRGSCRKFEGWTDIDPSGNYRFWLTAQSLETGCAP